MTYKVEIQLGNKKDFQIDLEFTTDNVENLIPQICQFELKKRQMTPKYGGKNVKYNRPYEVDKTGVVEIR